MGAGAGRDGASGRVGAGMGARAGAGTGATGAIPGTTEEAAATCWFSPFLLSAVTVLLPTTPKTTLLNISSTFFCRLFIQVSFLPVAVASLSTRLLGNLKGELGVVTGENKPLGNGIGTAGGGVGAVTNSNIS